MNTKDANFDLENNANLSTTNMLKPSTAITQTVCSEDLQIKHFTDYCERAEDFLKQLKNKVQDLTRAKKEGIDSLSDYSRKMTVNELSTHCLQKACLELYTYKCELKSNYLRTAMLNKSRRIKYKKILSSYESEWKRTLAQYNYDPTVAGLLQIQKENSTKEEEIEKLKKLKNITEIQFKELQKNLEQKYLEKVVEFSEAMIDYNKLLDFQKKKKKKKDVLELPKKSAGSPEFSVRRSGISNINIKKFIRTGVNAGTRSPSIDISVFDSLIPTEGLEIQNEEELTVFDKKDEENGSADAQSENKGSDPDQIQEWNNPEDFLEAGVLSTKPVENDEKESQYFQPQMSDQLKQQKQPNKNVQTTESLVTSQKSSAKCETEDFDKNSISEKSRPCRSDEEFRREKKIVKEGFRAENEENFSGGSCESQYHNLSLEEKRLSSSDYNENFELQGSNTPSAHSNDNSQHTNDSCGSPGQSRQEKHDGGDFVLKMDNEKEDFNLFNRLFSTGKSTPQKPSIFKLF